MTSRQRISFSLEGDYIISSYVYSIIYLDGVGEVYIKKVLFTPS